MIRRLGVLEGLTRKELGERQYPPGQHGPTRRRREPSQYGVRLREKQKLRYYYGVTETQLRNYFQRAARQSGPTGENLLVLLERRLDNVVFRFGLAPTIPAARQLVTHGHVTVNDRRVTAPGLEVKRGDVVSVREGSRRMPLVAEGVANGPSLAVPKYLGPAEDRIGGRVVSNPDRADVPVQVQESLVVEFYAR